MKATFYSHSFGCRVNQAEKEELDRQLLDRGYSFTEADPALFIINSCSVTHKAEREAKQLIYQVKRKNPATKVIVTGCAATNWLKTKEEIPEIDLIVDNQNKEYLAELIQKRFIDINVSRHSGKAQPHLFEPEQPQSRRPESGSKTRSWTSQDDVNVEINIRKDKYLNSKRIILKTQDGCQRFCTYCIVPYLRGLPKSIPKAEIVHKLQAVQGEVNEAILSSINTEAYGYDTKETFIDLLKEVLDQTTLPRISFGSIHPWTINDTFFNFYTQHPGNERIVKFFHIPLQSGSNKILQIMKRGYTREEFVEKLQKLASFKPHTFIATDVIVGYLEETDADFEDTYNFLKESPISKFHIFRFSKREHTAAFYLAKRLKEPRAEDKQKRAKALAELSKAKYEAFLRTHVNERFPALFLEKMVEGKREALLDNQVPVLIDTDKNLTGEIKNVFISSYTHGRLVGTLQ